MTETDCILRRLDLELNEVSEFQQSVLGGTATFEHVQLHVFHGCRETGDVVVCQVQLLKLLQVGHLKRKSIQSTKQRNEMFYLTTHSTHFIYGYMALDIW